MAFNIAYNIIAIDKFSSVSKKISSSLSSLSNKFSKLNNSMRKGGEHFSKFGNKLTIGAGIPLTGIAVTSVKTAASFERSMNMVQAVSGATAIQFKKLSDQAMNLGATTQFTSTQVAEGQKFMALAGSKTNKIIEAMPSVLQLAAATQSDFGSAARVVTNVMAGYNLKASQLPKINDMIVATTINSKTNLQDFGESMKMVAPIASMAGLKFSEMSATIGELANAGIPAGQISTLLKRSIIELINPTSAMQKIMKKGHLTFTKSNGKLMSMVNILAKLKKSSITTKGVLALFGSRAGPIMQILLTKGSDALSKSQKKILSLGGVAKKIADVQMRGLTGAFLRLKSAGQALAITTTNSVEPSLISISNKLTGWMLAANNSSSATKRMAARFIGFGIVVGPAIAAIGKFLFWTSIIISKVPFASSIIKGLGFSIRMLWLAITSPIGLVIAGIAAVSLGIYELWKHFDKVKKVLKPFGQYLIFYVKNPLGTIVNDAEKVYNWFSRIFGKKHKMKIDSPNFNNKSLFDSESIKYSGEMSRQSQKVHSTVDVNVFDPHRYIKDIAGHTSGGDLNLNLGSNMAFSR